MFFSAVSGFVMLVFVLVFSIIIIGIIKSVAEWNRKNNSPILSVTTKIMTKRISSHSHYHDDGTHVSSTTTCFVTFEFDNGDRTELRLLIEKYGMLAV